MSPRCVVRPVCGGYSKGCGRFCRFPGRPAVIVVSDTSVLSCLAELGELSLLHRLYGVIMVTAMLREAMEGGFHRGGGMSRDGILDFGFWILNGRGRGLNR